jgi:twitching motility protein PilT
MALVQSLLTAIVRADGDALVMHVGERPYVVATAGPIELSAHGLNLEAMSGMLSQLLPPEALATLDEFGAVEHELARDTTTGENRFAVVAARGGDDIWIEIRRHRPLSTGDAPASAVLEDLLAPPPVTAAPDAAVDVVTQATPPPEPEPLTVASIFESADSESGLAEFAADPTPADPPEAKPAAPAPAEVPELVERASDRPRVVESPREQLPAQSKVEERHMDREETLADSDSPQVVVPMARPIRVDASLRNLSSRPGGIERLLRLASARGASSLYLPSDARPHLRIDGDIRVLEGEPVSSSTDVEAALLELMPEAARDALRRGEPTEWVSDLPEIGRVRGTTFRDYRGPGALFQMISARAASAEQLGLSREIQALATETDGLVLVAGPRASGKSTLIAAFVDAINRRRSDHVITLERQIRLVHENRSSLISQREVRGSADDVVAAARTALRENPDVLVIEDLRSAEVLHLVLDAAGSGLLVFASVTASSSPAAVERVLDLGSGDRRAFVQAALAEHLRGVVTQVLLRKSSGGRLAARELLLNTEAVASLIADGQVAQLPLAMDGGRKRGMVPLNDALVAFVQSGAVDVREAYRKAPDRATLLSLLKREGIDTSFVERLA